MKMMRVEEILKTVAGSVDFGEVEDYPGDNDDDKRTNFWKHVIQAKASDTGFGHLVLSILANGFTTCIGWDSDIKEITEGHHRLVAAILLGIDEIPTTWEGTEHFYTEAAYICAHGDGRLPDFGIDVEV